MLATPTTAPDANMLSADVGTTDAAPAEAAAALDPAAAAAAEAEAEAIKAAKKAAVIELFRGTGIARRSAGMPKSEYIQKKRLPVRTKAPKPKVEYVLDLGKKLGTCWRCTCPVHEADITDGYAIACEDGMHEYECKQDEYADSCAEYAASHPEEVAALRAAEGATAAPADDATTAEAAATEPTASAETPKEEAPPAAPCAPVE